MIPAVCFKGREFQHFLGRGIGGFLSFDGKPKATVFSAVPCAVAFGLPFNKKHRWAIGPDIPLMWHNAFNPIR